MLGGTVRWCSLELLLCQAAPGRGETTIAWYALLPRVTQDLDTVALVVGVVSGEVTVGLEPDRRVAAGEEELLPVAHDGPSFLGVGCSDRSRRYETEGLTWDSEDISRKFRW